MKIIVDKNIPFINGIFENIAEVQYLKGQNIDNQSIKETDALIIRTRTICNEALLHGSNVRFIATATAGTDHIDFDFCKKNDISVFAAAGCNASSVAQYVGSAISVWVEKNNYRKKPLTIGIIGCGHVGQEVEKLCKILKFNILLNDTPLQKLTNDKKFVPLNHICENADIITFHTPLTVRGEFSTKNLADEQFFQNLKRNPLIINAARGGVVCEKAMLEALEYGKISDFTVDCWENEPNIATEIVAESLLATPHIAGYSADGKKNATEMCVQAINHFFCLGLDNFSVKNLSAKKTVYSKGSELLKTLLNNYDIKFDSNNLKKNPQNFEDLRNNYRERREIEILSNL